MIARTYNKEMVKLCFLCTQVENVVATIEIPSNHQGIFLPDKKYSLELEDDFFET